LPEIGRGLEGYVPRCLDENGIARLHDPASSARQDNRRFHLRNERPGKQRRKL
jgi:hypothetical protein